MRIPFSVLRTAYQMAVDTVMANLTHGEDNYTLRDYWPACNGTIYVRPEQVPAATQAVAAAGVFAARVRA